MIAEAFPLHCPIHYCIVRMSYKAVLNLGHSRIWFLDAALTKAWWPSVKLINCIYSVIVCLIYGSKFAIPSSQRIRHIMIHIKWEVRLENKIGPGFWRHSQIGNASHLLHSFKVSQNCWHSKHTARSRLKIIMSFKKHHTCVCKHLLNFFHLLNI